MPVLYKTGRLNDVDLSGIETDSLRGKGVSISIVQAMLVMLYNEIDRLISVRRLT